MERKPKGRSEFRIVACRNMRFTGMIAGRNVCGTLAADAAETGSFTGPVTGTGLEASMLVHRRWSGHDVWSTTCQKRRAGVPQVASTLMAS
jgi:hypothetical protein